MLQNCWVRILFKIASVLAMLLVGGCSMLHDKELTTSNAYNTNNQIIQSPSDNKHYRYLTMASGLKVLLISNPATDKSAAAVNVNVGSFNDPNNRLGLAHFLEHMLFLGNKKYPKVDGYFQYVQSNGGTANAYTSDTQTNYFFDINSNKLHPALDQLAQFFVSPTLDPQYVERERHAVDAEYKLHSREDAWRIAAALNATSNPDHPKSRFSIGDLETLNNTDGISLWKDLKAFYNKYYVAQNISIVVYGKESLDTLESWVQASFKGVPSHPLPNIHIDTTPYTAKELGVRINLVPLKESRILSLNFALESSYPYYKKKPLGYLARIIGYEGKGSLHSFLKNKGLINSLAAYSTDLPNKYSEFIIRMELTPKGLENVNRITAVVFDFLSLIRKQGITQRLYNESRDISQLSFQFKSEDDPQRLVSTLASSMPYLPSENILNSAYLYKQYDPKLIRHFLNEMTPSHLRQIVIAKGLKTNTVEPYFGTHYSISPLSQPLKQRLNKPQEHSELTIPTPNAFIAKDFALKKGNMLEPERIIHNTGIDVWNMTDTQFAMPKAIIHIDISTPLASNTPEHLILLQLYTTLLDRSLNEYGYPAQEAGLYYGIGASREGLNITLSGYQDKQKLLLQNILTGINRFSPDKQTFKEEKERLITQLENKAFRPPYRQGLDVINQTIYPNYPNDRILLNAAQSTTFESLKKYSHSLYDHIHINMFIHGNHNIKEANHLGEMVKKALLTPHNAAEKYTEPYTILRKQQLTITPDFKHHDSVFIAYYPQPGTNNYTRAQFALLAKLIATPFFKSLRTEQQLGYIVYVGPKVVEKHAGIVFMVQSPKANPITIENKVHTFLQEQSKRLKKLTNKTLTEYQQGLVGALLQRDANLNQKDYRLWQNIQNVEPFNNHEAIAKEVNKLTVADIQKAIALLLKDKGSIIIRSLGEGQKKTAET